MSAYKLRIMLGQEIDELEHNVRRMKREKDASLLVAIVLLPEILKICGTCIVGGSGINGFACLIWTSQLRIP